MSTDSEIIRRSRDDPGAFGDLYLRHAAAVHRYSWRRAGEAVADDVTAETFLVAFEKRERFDLSIDDAKPWLFGIATNLLHGHRRAEARRLKTAARAADPDIVDDHSVRAGDLIDAASTMRIVARTLRKMPTVDRDCLLLYLQGELTYEDIAHAMGIPIGTVRSRLNRARRVLRQATDLTDFETENEHGRADTVPRNA
ncbi:RNA polymerase sigma factor [Salinibacterium sp. ZJ454]|uniref:RNA polymerase sigma factor n=1 Tax=Salinibacterium sp. ZJ454 TaxID=2708339 RepID=UPI001AB02E33|nr:RNA polymerase sigma factor [Salinibacterium sp. ZJ454]